MKNLLNLSPEMEDKLAELMILLDQQHHPHTTLTVRAVESKMFEGGDWVATVTNDILVD